MLELTTAIQAAWQKKKKKKRLRGAKESHLYDHKWVYGQNSWEIQRHQAETFHHVMSQKKNHALEEQTFTHNPISCFTMLPNPSNSKAAQTTACQRNQMQAVEKQSSRV